MRTFFLRLSLILVSLILFSGCCATRCGSGSVKPFLKSPCIGRVACQYRSDSPEGQPDRIYEHVVLDAGHIGEAHLTVSLPKVIPSSGLHTAIIMGGQETSKDTLDFIPDHGNYALIAYSYPESLHKVDGLSSVFSGPKIRCAVNQVPGQVLVTAEWARRQSWSDGKPVSLIGVSLGGMYVPVIHHLAQERCQDLGPSVMAYTGADLYSIIFCNLKSCFRTMAANMAYALVKNIEPACHLPHLKGDFLIVEGSLDEKIPESSRELLKELTPEPHTVITLETEHIAKDKEEIIEELYDVARDWLEEHR